LEVRLIAYTAFSSNAAYDATEGVWEPEDNTTYAEDLTEFAGRLCYQSWNRPNPATRANFDYIAHIIENQDFSVMEHASASLYVTGVSRAFTHQLIRHRHFSPSQLSQRYVNETGRVDPVVPEVIKDRLGAWNRYMEAVRASEFAYEQIVGELLQDGLTRKEARDAARYVLPNGQETRILITANHRAWREFFTKRRSDRASDEICEFANQAFDIMKNLAPNLYQDME
jgi:thymidylate synthase (FAD)